MTMDTQKWPIFKKKSDKLPPIIIIHSLFNNFPKINFHPKILIYTPLSLKCCIYVAFTIFCRQIHQSARIGAGVSGNDFWGFGNGKGIEKAHSRNSGTGRELKKPISEIREREGNKKIHSQISGMGREWKNPIPKIREREGNEKNPFPKFGNGKGMKKSIPKVRERESEASILGNDREREREWE